MSSHAAGSYRARQRRPNGAPPACAHHGHVQRSNRQVSLAWLSAALLGAFGLLDTRPAQQPAAPAESPPVLVLDAGQSSGFGCRVMKELRFEMLPANADLPLPTTRRTPVCLAAYLPSEAGPSESAAR